jgi:hypothetical protein
VFAFVATPQIDVETFVTWATTLVVKAMAIIRSTGEAVVTCGHEVSHDTGITELGEIPTGVGTILFLRTRGPVGLDGRQSVPRRPHMVPGRLGYAFMKALTEAGLLGGSKLNLKGTGWKTNGTS